MSWCSRGPHSLEELKSRLWARLHKIWGRIDKFWSFWRLWVALAVVSLSRLFRTPQEIQWLPVRAPHCTAFLSFCNPQNGQSCLSRWAIVKFLYKHLAREWKPSRCSPCSKGSFRPPARPSCVPWLVAHAKERNGCSDLPLCKSTSTSHRTGCTFLSILYFLIQLIQN